MRLFSTAVSLAMFSAMPAAQAEMRLEVSRRIPFQSELDISNIMARLAGGATLAASTRDVADVLRDEAKERLKALCARVSTRFADGYSEQAVAETFYGLGELVGALVQRTMELDFTARLELDGHEVQIDLWHLCRAHCAVQDLISGRDRARKVGYTYGFTVRGVRVSRSTYASDGEVVLTADLAGRLRTQRTRVGPVTATVHLDGARFHLVAREFDQETRGTMTATAQLTLQLCYGSRSCLVNKLAARLAPGRASDEANKIAGTQVSRILRHLLQVSRDLVKTGNESPLVLVYTFYQKTIAQGLRWE